MYRCTPLHAENKMFVGISTSMTYIHVGLFDSIFLLNQYIYVQLYAAYASIETDVI